MKMSLEEKVMTGMKLAMRTKQTNDLRALRAVKAAILIAKTEKGATEVLTAEKEIALLQKMIKQRKESAAIFKQQNRPELEAKELLEIECIDQFLPEQMSEDEIVEIIDNLILKTGASSMKDMGKVMGMASKTFAGKADNSLVSSIIKAKLS